MIDRLGVLVREARSLARQTAGGMRDRVDRLLAPPDSDRALRRQLVAEGAALWPRRPSALWTEWVNAALRTERDRDRARAEVVDCGLAPHVDRPKNWDHLVALGLILDRLPPTARVLDAGAKLNSPLLPWLYLYGYRDLHGIGFGYDGIVRRGPIRYERMDLTKTTFADSSFDAITCLSVIEHGVPLDGQLAEAARLLKPAGLLVISTDYWCSPVDTGGQVDYGVPIRIFEPPEIEAYVDLAARHGFRPVRPLDLRCEERVVNWSGRGLDYTFLTIAMTRHDPGGARPRTGLGRWDGWWR